MVKNEAGGCKGKKVARKHTTKGKNELRLSASSDEKYAIVKKMLGNTCDVICDDGKERRCIIRGKFTGRNKRDNMLDNGTYTLVGLREWVVEDINEGGGGGGSGGGGNNKGIRYCDLLEVYNSMERDILRRTHNVFSTLKDESGNKYDEADSSVMFVDDNTLKYQNMIKKMEKKSGSGGSAGSGESEESDESDECKEQTVVITTSVKYVGKGVIEQSFDISDDEDDDDDDDDDDSVTINKATNVRPEVKLETSASYHKKKVAYHQESEVNVDDI
jgi:hypothetical protein